MKEIIKKAIINSFVTALYIILIASFMFYLGQNESDAKSVFIPIAMLMLFVFSAAFTGSLVFGKPLMLYIDGKRKEALSLLFYTLGILLIITIISFILIGLFII